MCIRDRYTPPCFAAIGAMNSEMKSAKWIWGGIGLQLGVGYSVGYPVSYTHLEAKNAQAMNEARILELEMTIKNARVIEASEMTNEKVHMGSKVRVFNSLLDEEQTYTIVGSAEVEPLELKVSDESPIGKALSGSKVGDVVEVNTPAGKVFTLEILEIKMCIRDRDM